jgi:N-acetylmuramoyl-L-alanine amidase
VSRKLARHPLFFLIIFSIFAFLFSPLPTQSQIQTTQKTIVLDAGHGGEDSGLVSHLGVTEKQMSMQLARYIAGHLENQYNIILTRTGDQALSPENRVGIANQARADLYVSLHLYSGGGQQVWGYFFSHPDPEYPSPRPDDTRWRILALKNQPLSKAALDALAHVFSNQTPPASFSILGAPIKLLQGTTMPAVLIEAASISSIPGQPDQQNRFFQTLSRCIAEGIHLYFNKYQPIP